MSEQDSSSLSGTRVRVCYSDGFWYLGAIDSYHEPTGKYRILLDDGDRYVFYPTASRTCRYLYKTSQALSADRGWPHAWRMPFLQDFLGYFDVVERVILGENVRDSQLLLRKTESVFSSTGYWLNENRHAHQIY
jgi:hypothetical protein